MELLMRGALLCAVVLQLTAATLAHSQTLDEVLPGRVRDSLAATVRATELPGARLEASLTSGLPAAIELELQAWDDHDRRIGESRLFYRIAWDLWEEYFRVEGPAASVAGSTESAVELPVRRFDDVAALRSFLHELPYLSVTSMASLAGDSRHRVRVAGRLHRVAPRETARLEQWVAGDDASSTTDDPNGRDVSVSLGSVIRFFYKEAQRDADVLDARFSAWFVPGDLPETGLSLGEATP